MSLPSEGVDLERAVNATKPCRVAGKGWPPAVPTESDDAERHWVEHAVLCLSGIDQLPIDLAWLVHHNDGRLREEHVEEGAI